MGTSMKGASIQGASLKGASKKDMSKMKSTSKKGTFKKGASKLKGASKMKGTLKKVSQGNIVDVLRPDPFGHALVIKAYEFARSMRGSKDSKWRQIFILLDKALMCL